MSLQNLQRCRRQPDAHLPDIQLHCYNLICPDATLTMNHITSDLDTTLDYRKAEFANPATESRFRQWSQKGTVTQTRLTLLITLSLLIVYIVSDYFMLRADNGFVYSLVIRTIIFIGGLITLAVISVTHSPALFDRIIFIFQALAGGLLLFIFTVLKTDIVAASLAVVLVAISMYLLMPNRLIVANLLSLSLSVGFFILAVTIYDLGQLLLLQLAMIMLGANLIGAIFCARFHLIKRKEFLELMRERSAREALQEEIAKRLKLEKKLLHQTRTDELTGATNRRYFMQLGEEEINRSHRYGRHMSLLMLDLDHFKEINDQYGHSIGDEALVRFSQLCRSTLRKPDIFGRLGGEEFAIIIPEESLEGAMRTAERLRLRVEEDFATTDYKLTVSIGVTELDIQDSTIGDLLRRADNMMYKAKHHGRNCVIAFPPLASQESTS